MFGRNTISLILLHIIGAACLLLWGARMVRTGFTRAYGTSLRRGIGLGTGNRLTAFVSGVFVTACLQSSTATTLIVSSFIKRGFITTAASIAVIIGADLSTTLVAQVLTFDLSWLSPALLAGGIITYMLNDRSGRVRHMARAAIGIGLMLLSLSLIREVSEPLKHSEVLPLILAPLENEPLLAIIFAALFTWLIHSSLAAVLLFAALAANHILTLHLGLYLVMGANIGGALVPFAATYADGAKVRRVTSANIFMRGVILILCLPFVQHIMNTLTLYESAIDRQIVDFHMGFNIALAIIFLPLAGLLAKAAQKLLPEKAQAKDDFEPLYLDGKSLDAPVIALASAARETLRLAEIVEAMLEKTITAFEKNDAKLVNDIRKMDDKVDSIYEAIKLYMTRLTQESLDPKEADRYVQILTFSTNLEHCGDIIEKNLMELADKKIRKQENFSKEGFAEITEFHGRVLENLRLAQTIFLSEDPALAAQLVEKKATVRKAEAETSRQHFDRLREGRQQTIATSALHLDIIRDLRRINSYVTSVAYTIIDNHEKHKEKRKDDHKN